MWVIRRPDYVSFWSLVTHVHLSPFLHLKFCCELFHIDFIHFVYFGFFIHRFVIPFAYRNTEKHKWISMGHGYVNKGHTCIYFLLNSSWSEGNWLTFSKYVSNWRIFNTLHLLVNRGSGVAKYLLKKGRGFRILFPHEPLGGKTLA